MSRTGLRLWVGPRYGTPRNRDRATYGPQVSEVSRRLGRDPMPHQGHVWDVALEVDADGRFAYDEVVVSIMRQQGKTIGVFAKSVWRDTVAPKLLKPDGKPWGRQASLYTAQRRIDARAKLEREFAELLKHCPPIGDPRRPSLPARKSFTQIVNPKGKPARPAEWKLSLNNGAECIQFGSGWFLIDAPSEETGHSATLDDVNIDEAWALENDDLETGVEPTMATRWNPQKWVFSTAGTDRSFYLWSKIRAGRGRSCTCRVQFLDDCTCGFDPGATRTAFFDYSIPDDADIDDEEVWWEYMPALGRTISPEFIGSQLQKARDKPEDGGEDAWRRSYGNQWMKIPMLGAETRLAKLPAEQWAASRIAWDDVPVMNPGSVVFSFDVAPGGTWSSIAVAAGTQAAPYVELVDGGHAEGTGWVPQRLVELVARWKPKRLGFDQTGPAAALVDLIRAALINARLDASIVTPLTSQEYRAACGALYLDVLEGRLHRASDQGPLDIAGDDATERRIGDAWVWDRRSATVPICPLVAATCARALLPVGTGGPAATASTPKDTSGDRELFRPSSRLNI